MELTGGDTAPTRCLLSKRASFALCLAEWLVGGGELHGQAWRTDEDTASAVHKPTSQSRDVAGSESDKANRLSQWQQTR